MTSAQADADIEAAVDHLIETGDLSAADGLIDALQAARNVIAEFPSLGSFRFAIETGIPELRDIAVRRYPYVIFYTEDEDAVRVHRVLHTSRDIPSTLLDQSP